MKLLFTSLSLLTFLITESTLTVAQAGKTHFGEPDHERKHAERVFPKGFKKDPLKPLDEKLMGTILECSLYDGNIYKRSMFRKNKVWVYESKTLYKLDQVGSSPTFELRSKAKKNDSPIKYMQWNFILNVTHDKDGEECAQPSPHTFSIFLYPYDKFSNLSPEDRARVGAIAEAHREVKASRPDSLTPDYVPQATDMIEAMSHISLVSGTKNVQEYITSSSDEEPKEQKIEEIIDRVSTAIDKEKDSNQHQFKRRAREWKLSKQESKSLTKTEYPLNDKK